MRVPVSSRLSAAVLTAMAAAVPVSASAAGAPGADPLAGTRTISTARPGVIPECLTVDDKGRVGLATLCFREGADHSWTLNAVPAAAGSYVLARGRNCLSLDPTRVPHLLALACRADGIGQIWQITPRQPGQYQIAQGGVCVQAGTADAGTAPCRRGLTLGNDDSGQAWKILKDPQSVVPDPTFGGPVGPKPRPA